MTKRKKGQENFIRKKKWLAVSLIGVAVFVGFILILQNLHPVSSKSINDTQITINSFGCLAPLAVIVLVILSTVIPPLPLPIPAVEIVAGLLFGFWKGFIISWIAEIISSSLAFYFTKIFGKPIVRYFIKHPVFKFHRYSMQKRGALSVFITRITFINPFNVISFMAGLTQMSYISFLIATILGTLPEVILFPFIGSIFRTSQFNASYIFTLMFIIAGIGLASIFIIICLLSFRKRK